MKVDELRKIIKKYDENQKEKIIIELYKRIPKYKKEEYDVDDYINNIDSNNNKAKVKKEVNFEQLEAEINYFLLCVDNDLYSTPNRVIPKTERSKWRFKVKNYYKELNKILPQTEEGKKATDLLKEIYVRLSYGTHYLKFSSWNTFGAIQVTQNEFLNNIMERKLTGGLTKENLNYCVELLNVKHDPQILDSSLLVTFESCLKTTDARYMALDILKEQVDAWTLKYKEKDKYEYEEQANFFTQGVVEIYFELYEFQEGIKYFHRKYIETYKEIKEYILLEIIEDFELYQEWIKEYEKHLGKIKYRDSLVEKYEEFKKLNS